MFNIHGLQWLQLLCTMLTSYDKGDVLQKGHTEAHLTQVINRFQDIQQLLPTSDARATMDRALLHICAASSLLNATEVTSGAGDVTAGKEAPLPCPHLGTRKRTCQNNPKLPAQNSKTNGENVQHENAGGKNDTQTSEHNAQRKESETNRNNSNSEDKEDGSEEEGNTDTNDGHRSDNKINPPKNSTARKPNQCWCIVYDSNQDVEDHIKLDHANNSYICSECKLPLGTQQSLWSHFRKQHLGIYQYTCQELKKMVQVLNAASIETNYLRYCSTLRQSMEKGERMSGANFVTCRFRNRGM